MGHSNLLAAGQTGSIMLGGLPQDDFSRIQRHLEPVTLRPKEVLGEVDRPPTHVYFPESGMTSLLAVLTRDKPVEMASVGREGMVGMGHFFGVDYLPERIVVQIPGRAMRMEADTFATALQDCTSLNDSLKRYAACLYAFAGYNVACALKHRTTARLARWLLHACDQSGTTNLQLTHTFAALMLGVRRSSVTLSAGALRSQKLVAYGRSTIEVIDRDGLEGVACECYARIRSTYERVMIR